MSVRIDNFVSVNITRRTAFAQAEYDTAVFVANADIGDYGYYTVSGGPTKRGTKADPYSIKDYIDDLPGGVLIFFENGGKCLHIIEGIAYSTTSGTGWVATETGGGETELPLNEIVIFGPSVAAAAIAANPTEGIYQKLFLVQQGDTATPETTASGLIYKVNDAVATTGDICGTIAAYYTKILLDDPRTIRDYMFTPETVATASQMNADEGVKECIAANLNCDTYLAGAVRNIGGNDSTGEDITNLFMRIVLQQVLSNALLNLLASKIKLNQNGIISVKNACSAVLQRFVNNGYIDPEKLWTEPDLYIDNNLVVAQDTPLTGGYLIYVGKITKQNIADRQIPNVYILYGDSVGVRKIVVSGEVF